MCVCVCFAKKDKNRKQDHPDQIEKQGQTQGTNHNLNCYMPLLAYHSLVFVVIVCPFVFHVCLFVLFGVVAFCVEFVFLGGRRHVLSIVVCLLLFACCIVITMLLCLLFCLHCVCEFCGSRSTTLVLFVVLFCHV